MTLEQIIQEFPVGDFLPRRAMKELLKHRLRMAFNIFETDFYEYVGVVKGMLRVRALLRLDVTGHPRAVEYPLTCVTTEKKECMKDVEAIFDPNNQHANRDWDKLYQRVLWLSSSTEDKMLSAIHTTSVKGSPRV